ncbi:3-deoxy-7-phosphoheptulonate synthase [Candidatus Palibaumannia cicadellinicola]|uniref:Phospho-2-dehydro-3-deoxyheptonate aldolase n=1 Tax=Baumannia cicadellinicola subsp. Homalodisca coagulata TaxID=374463 RepID=Q1LTR6_BAUCH|nr:3-deoxy-7-phosphoheptulonate synthase [Candidatus Baumannia cicadellinicola]ABF14143.1 phospho-2-dehydro-3-deoxyheptonate aldolase [Baumannia cicadellinicola str. Hc (Homalodisca coagulata)]MBS0032933.1 3-deoxy-7-phosphoheptulonate synthase [Candidatus Baumannia cicadellinicola]MCJ7462368.1 3-deoxy-7-phosphoheptulonate synthase [Candidatus Baumannia cicadellinicola]MCJ7462915.1 3-deoxy-7-phosphoheptulonate synthase [Candidatus Baumannia cicadellinicola]
MITPDTLKKLFPLSDAKKQLVIESRKIITDIIHGSNPRLLVVCGPCSIHDKNAAIDYAQRLQTISWELKDKIYLVMRVYLEKPRTTFGWKGLISDPYMDGSCDVEAGMQIARSLLVELISIGIPLATEALNPHGPQYLGDLFSWVAIGARTTESQIHREMASGLSMPVGFKNSTYGILTTAINAITVAKRSHRFIGINQAGQVTLLQTSGNLDGHLILRGGNKPNYYPHDIKNCTDQMISAGLSPRLIIDCSHGNSNHDYRRQVDVVQSVIAQIKAGNNSIRGIILESNIYSGNQSAELPKSKMRYGVSVTDSCINWNTTQHMLRRLHSEL